MTFLGLEASFALVGLSCVPFSLWYFGGKLRWRNAFLCLASAASAALAARAEGPIPTLALLEMSSLLLALVLLEDRALFSLYLSVQVISGTAAISGLALSRCPGAREAGLFLATLGLLLKAGVFPLHFWLPKVHGNAPAPASALLSSVAVAGGALALSRLIPPGEVSSLLFWSGVGSVLWGAGQGLFQRDSKRALAYSTLSAMGVAVILASRGFEGRLALEVHLSAHALYKAASFMALGVVDRNAGRDLLALREPFRGAWPALLGLLLAFASAIGVPATLGFESKELSKQALLRLGKGIALLASTSSPAVMGRLSAFLVASGLRGSLRGGVDARRDGGILLLAASLLLPLAGGPPTAGDFRAWAGEAALALKLSLAAFLFARPLVRPRDLEDLPVGGRTFRALRALARRPKLEGEEDLSWPYALAVLTISLALAAVAMATALRR